MKINPFFLLYQWFIALPVLIVITALVALATIILSPITPNSQIAYYPARWWGRMFCYLLFIRVKISGLEHLDPKQSYIVAANHQSAFDIFVIYGWYPYIFKWIMKAELRRIPLVGKACESVGHIFMDRSNPVAARKSLERAESQLTNGISVVIFPEGTRTYTGKMMKFKKGAFRLATELRLPIAPLTIRGSFDRMKRNTFMVSPGVIELIFHAPVDISPYSPDQLAPLMQVTYDIIESAL